MVVLDKVHCLFEAILIDYYLLGQFKYGERFSFELIEGWEGKSRLFALGSCLLIAVKGENDCGILFHVCHHSGVWLNLVVKVTRIGQLPERLEISFIVNVDVAEIQSIIAAKAALPKHSVELVVSKSDICSILTIT